MKSAATRPGRTNEKFAQVAWVARFTLQTVRTGADFDLYSNYAGSSNCRDLFQEFKSRAVAEVRHELAILGHCCIDADEFHEWKRATSCWPVVQKICCSQPWLFRAVVPKSTQTVMILVGRFLPISLRYIIFLHIYDQNSTSFY